MSEWSEAKSALGFKVSRYLFRKLGSNPVPCSGLGLHDEGVVSTFGAGVLPRQRSKMVGFGLVVEIYVAG